MRVLLVAPRKSDLASVDAEVQDILSSGLSVDPLLGDITSEIVLRKIRDGNYDILWFATHGNGQYIELSGDERLNAEELVPLVRNRFTLVVLNTCDSWRIARMIQIQANVGVIASILNTYDATAYKFGSLLSRELIKQPTIADAYLASLFGNDDTYMYLPALRVAQESIDSLRIVIEQLKEQIGNEVLWLRRLLWSSLVLHLIEGIAIIWLWLRLMGV